MTQLIRKIEPKLIAWIDEKIKDNLIAKQALEEKHARGLLIEVARSFVGIREATGNNDGPIVELIQETVGSADKESWCLSFQQSCIAYVEVKLNIKSRLIATEHCLTLWNASTPDQKVQWHPLPGAIPIWRHGATTNGHTGIVLESGLETFKAIEGNTSSGIDPNQDVVRNGQGVYITKRSMIGTGNMRVVGFLKPF